MNLRNLTMDNWRYFETNYEAAYYWLVKTSLINEWEQLEKLGAHSEHTMTDWEMKRYQDLKEWRKTQLAIDPNYFNGD